MRADMHSHSTASDGTCPPEEVMRRASAAGLDAIALTDHDTVAGHRAAAGALPPGLTLVPGMELSCRLQGHSVHLLGYLFDPADAELAAECARIRESRVHRAGARAWMMPDDVIADLAAAGLHGVEVWHPDQDQAQRAHLTALAADLGLVASGGSDDHGALTGYRIGCETIAPEEYQRLLSQATGAAPERGR
jgi:predicted metal-dependent phosphoesterase TrpH